MDQVDLPMIQWDIDTLDWDTKDADNTVKVILEQAKPGSIILMHDIYSASAEAAERVIPELIKQGYQLVTVSELFEIYGQRAGASSPVLRRTGGSRHRKLIARHTM